MTQKQKPNKVYYCSHAQERMKERNIKDDDVLDTLYKPQRVKRARKKGRFVAERAFSSGSYDIQVVYSIEDDEYGLPMFNVITAMKIKGKGGRR